VKTRLEASVGGEPNQPPTSSWIFDSESMGDRWVEDPTVSCTIPSTSPPCCLTVSLSGAAKEAQGKCEGEYKSTGLVSTGREVFKLEGSSDFYFFVKPGKVNWAIWSNLKATKRYIRSGSAGQACPAHPSNKINKRLDFNDWSFNKAEDDDDEEDWEEEGVVVQCTVHEHSST